MSLSIIKMPLFVAIWSTWLRTKFRCSCILESYKSTFNERNFKMGCNESPDHHTRKYFVHNLGEEVYSIRSAGLLVMQFDFVQTGQVLEGVWEIQVSYLQIHLAYKMGNSGFATKIIGVMLYTYLMSLARRYVNTLNSMPMLTFALLLFKHSQQNIIQIGKTMSHKITWSLKITIFTHLGYY